MLRMLKVICAAMLLSVAARAQDVFIHAVNGQTGAPLANQKVVVFVFDKLPNPKTTRYVLVADDKGLAMLPAVDITGKNLQVGVKGATMCVGQPNQEKLSVENIRFGGVSAENNCSRNVSFRPKANELYVYARFMKYGATSAD